MSAVAQAGAPLVDSMEQLFPGQRLDIVLNGQPPRQTEVVWCKRLAPGRYAVGCHFTTEG